MLKEWESVVGPVCQGVRSFRSVYQWSHIGHHVGDYGTVRVSTKTELRFILVMEPLPFVSVQKVGLAVGTSVCAL